MPLPSAIVLCQAGYEGYLERELGQAGYGREALGPGWVRVSQAKDNPLPLAECAFGHAYLEDPVSVEGASVNAIAGRIMEVFSEGIRGERLEGAWPCIFEAAAGADGLSRRTSSVESAFAELLKRKLSRVSKLASTGYPRVGASKGLFVWFTDFGTAWVSSRATFNGPSRMADDDLAPSRSYLKVEEAYGILGAEPVLGESVCDLGAAPGGWTYSAAKRGARVVAVDNRPLKGGALGNPHVDHRKVDAFGFQPGPGETYDWLFCDMLEDPRRVIPQIVKPWLSQRWCRRFVVNLKFGRVDPVEFLSEIRGPQSPFFQHGASVRVSHLYHDREEFTVTGLLAP